MRHPKLVQMLNIAQSCVIVSEIQNFVTKIHSDYVKWHKNSLPSCIHISYFPEENSPSKERYGLPDKSICKELKFHPLEDTTPIAFDAHLSPMHF